MKCIDNEYVNYKRFKPYNSKELAPVGFSCVETEEELTDEEIYRMIDDVIYQVLGPQGLASIVKPGDKVVIKVNLIGTGVGTRGKKNRGGITDPRIVLYVASKVRNIIGFDGNSDLKVVDATFYKDKNPSLKESDMNLNFYWARLERNGDDAVDKKDVCYDDDCDGFLDGVTRARLVNLDSLLEDQREVTRVKVASSKDVTVCLPKLLRTREEAEKEKSDEYCDVLIGLPILKSHALTGLTGAVKLHYGFRHYEGMKGDTGRYGHSGLTFDANGTVHNREFLLDYLSAEHIVRDYDFVIMDCITGNRSGPMSQNSGLLFNSHKNEAIDYILTNSMLASKDSVALDTVAAVLGGYDPDSIELLKNANENGIGTNNPNYILLSGLTNFYQHRQYLYNKYSPDHYPFFAGWGGAQILANNTFEAKIKLEEPKMLSKGIYAIKYSVEGLYDEILDLSRVELRINGKLIQYKNEGNLCKGTFILNIAKEHLPENSSLDFIVAVWDKYFNCIQSAEMQYFFW